MAHPEPGPGTRRPAEGRVAQGSTAGPVAQGSTAGPVAEGPTAGPATHGSTPAPETEEPRAGPAGGCPSVEETAALAARLHAGQLDKAGEAYIGHPLRVRATVERTAPAAGVDPVHAQLAALLHDVVEDTPTTLTDLAGLGYPAAVLAAVDALSKRPGEPSEVYLRRVAVDPLAVVVKRADMADNSDPVRLGRLPAEQAARLATRYAGRRVLLDDLTAAAHQ